jgi:hypothetical protein
MKIEPYGQYRIVSIAQDGKKCEWNLEITPNKKAWKLANSEVCIGDNLKGFLIQEIYEMSEYPLLSELMEKSDLNSEKIEVKDESEIERPQNVNKYDNAIRKIVNSKHWLTNLEIEYRNRNPRSKVEVDPWFTNKSGIYQIKNKQNGNYYIGRSKNVDYRWRSHINDLIENIHHNHLLQEDWWWNPNGYFFTFEILESCMDIDELVEVEQEYIDNHFGNSNCYNLSPYAYGEPWYIEMINNKRWNKAALT